MVKYIFFYIVLIFLPLNFYAQELSIKDFSKIIKLNKLDSKDFLLKKGWIFLEDNSSNIEVTYRYPTENNSLVDFYELTLLYSEKEVLNGISLSSGNESIENFYRKELKLEKFRSLRNTHHSGFYVETFASQDENFMLGISKSDSDYTKILGNPLRIIYFSTKEVIMKD